MSDAAQIQAQAEAFRSNVSAISDAIGRVIVGQRDIIEHCIVGLLAEGHVLLEGVPGLGKTLLVRTMARTIDCRFSRVQFTPDLMPADITGTNIVQEEAGQRRFVFQRGPVFGNIVLADEINRATPKTQSALLEAMQERGVTVAGTTYPLEAPFFVLATQNPIEMEGTYPLPEAQLDRFLFKLEVQPANVKELAQVLDQTTGSVRDEGGAVCQAADVVRLQAFARQVPVAPHLLEYCARLVLATHPDNEFAPSRVKQFARYGSSPRGGQSIIRAAKVRALIKGRYNVSGEDIRHYARPALRHRVLLNFEGEAEGIRVDDLVSAVIDAVPDVAEHVKKL